MARIKLNFPDRILGTVNLRVRITDINYGNHLGNDSLVSLLHEARVLWLQKLGYTEFNIEGKSIIQSELVVNYIGESFFGDDLEFKIAPGDIGSSGFELYYEVSAIRSDGAMTIARAKTGLVFFDYQNRRVTAIPDRFINILTEK
jgi:acyl-CoA thioesterase FadM